jgi:hypothetical protein
MTKIQQTQKELEAHLGEQLHFLEVSAESFDKGDDSEAKRMAVHIRTLLHDTPNSQSLLKLLGLKEKTVFIDSSSDKEDIVSYTGLVLKSVGPKGGRYIAPLDDAPPNQVFKKVSFDDYWEKDIFIDNKGGHFSRKRLVLAIANKDGGAHVDPELDKEYAELTKENSLGWIYGKVLVEEKRNVGRVSFIFYRDKAVDKLYVLGTLCYTSYSKDKKRLILFPGILGRNFLWHSIGGHLKDEIILDHLTIEPDFKTWHYTAFKKGDKKKYKFESNHFIEIVPGLRHWFSLSLNNVNVFEPLSKKYMLTFRTNSNEVDSINEKLMEARGNTIEHIIEQVSDDPDFKSEFLHFDFFVDQRKIKNTDAFLKASVVPQGDLLVSGTAGITPEFGVMQYDIKIKDFDGSIAVLVSKHKGRLTREVLFGSQ